MEAEADFDHASAGLWNLSSDVFTAAAELDRSINDTLKESSAKAALESPGGARDSVRFTSSRHSKMHNTMTSVDSRASFPSTAGSLTDASLGTTSKGSSGGVVDTLQQQVAQYIQKALDVNEELQGIERQIAEVQKELEKRQISRGGFKAVQENEKAVQRTEAIMETRIANALAEFMNYTAANNRLHAEIDKLRYDKLAFKVASASVEKECKALVAESQDLEKSIGQKHAQQEEVEHECNAIRAESDSKQEELQAEYLTLQSRGGPLQMPDLTVNADAAAAARKASTTAGATTGASDKGKLGASGGATLSTTAGPVAAGATASPAAGAAGADRDASRASVAKNCEEVAKAVCSILGLANVDEFVHRYEQGDDTNYALYCRVDELMKETEEYRGKVAEAREASARTFQEQHQYTQICEERQRELQSVNAAFKQLHDKQARIAAQYEHEAKSQAAVRRGLRVIIESLGGDEIDGLSEGHLMDYFGIVETQIKELLVWCYTHQQRHPPVSPITEGSSTGSSARRKHSFRQANNSTPVAFAQAEQAEGGASAGGAVVSTETVTVGPSNSTGSLYRVIASQVQAPGLDGPKDVRQTAAYLQPFINASQLDSTGNVSGPVMALSASMASLMAQVTSGTATTTGGKRTKETASLTNFPEDDDRPVSVPQAATRNGTTPLRLSAPQVLMSPSAGIATSASASSLPHPGSASGSKRVGNSSVTSLPPAVAPSAAHAELSSSKSKGALPKSDHTASGTLPSIFKQ